MQVSVIRIHSIRMRSVPSYSEDEVREHSALGAVNNRLLFFRGLDIAHVGNSGHLKRILDPVCLTLPPVNRSIDFTLLLHLEGTTDDARLITNGEYFSVDSSLPSWARPVSRVVHPSVVSGPLKGAFALRFTEDCRDKDYDFILEQNHFCACVFRIKIADIVDSAPIGDRAMGNDLHAMNLKFNTPIPINTVGGVTQIFQIRKLRLHHSTAGFQASLQPQKPPFVIRGVTEDKDFLYISIHATPRSSKIHRSEVSLSIYGKSIASLKLEATAYNPLDEVGLMEIPVTDLWKKERGTMSDIIAVPSCVSIIDERPSSIMLSNRSRVREYSYEFLENPIFIIEPSQGMILPNNSVLVSFQIRNTIPTTGYITIPCCISSHESPTEVSDIWIEVTMFNTITMNRALIMDCIFSEIFAHMNFT